MHQIFFEPEVKKIFTGGFEAITLQDLRKIVKIREKNSLT